MTKSSIHEVKLNIEEAVNCQCIMMHLDIELNQIDDVIIANQLNRETSLASHPLVSVQKQKHSVRMDP